MVNGQDEIVVTGRTQAQDTENGQMLLGKWSSNGKVASASACMKKSDLLFGYLYNASVGQPSYDSWEIYFDSYERR